MHPFSSYPSSVDFFNKAGFKPLGCLTPEVEESIFSDDSLTPSDVSNKLFMYYGFLLAGTTDKVCSIYYSFDYEDLFSQIMVFWSFIVSSYNPDSHLSFVEYCGAKPIMQLKEHCRRQIAKNPPTDGLDECRFEEAVTSASELYFANAQLEALIELDANKSQSAQSLAATALLDSDENSQTLADKFGRSRRWVQRAQKLLKDDITNGNPLS